MVDNWLLTLQVYTGKAESLESSEGTYGTPARQESSCSSIISNKQLLVDLEEKGIYACGTARKDRRGFPDMLKTAKLTSRCMCVCVTYYVLSYTLLGEGMQLQSLNRNSLRLVIGFLSLATYATTHYLCVCVIILTTYSGENSSQCRRAKLLQVRGSIASQ